MAKVPSTVVKTTTLAALEKAGDKGRVFVLNRSTNDEPGRIVLSIPKLNGNGQDLVRIPHTFVAIDLTEQIPKNQLMQSSDFRKTVNSGLLDLVTEEYAELLLGTPEGKAEVRRLQNEAQMHRTANANAGVVNREVVEVSKIGKAEKAEAEKTVRTEPQTRIQSFVLEAKNDRLNAAQIIAGLKRINTRSPFLSADFKFLGREYMNNQTVLKGVRDLYEKRKAETTQKD